MTDNNWTEKMVADRFEEAVRTLRRLDVGRIKPMEYFSTWPEIVYTAWEVMLQDKLPVRLGPPPADEITRMEKAFEWLFWIEVEERHLIWWRAENKPWKPICGYLGYGREKARKIRKNALVKIAQNLNEGIKGNKGKDIGGKKC